jgi:hypothetical protein
LEKQEPSLLQQTEEQTWIALADRIGSDKSFKEACLRRSEKFDMQFQQLVCEAPAIHALAMTMPPEQVLFSHSICSEMSHRGRPDINSEYGCKLD